VVFCAWPLFTFGCAAGQNPTTNPAQNIAQANASNLSKTQIVSVSEPQQQTPRSTNEIIERVFKREPEEDETISSYASIVETHVQEEKSDPLMGTLSKTDQYFLGQLDFRSGRLRVHSMTRKTHKLPGMRPSTWPGMRSFDPAGFL
jgi:hypothetical protein